MNRVVVYNGNLLLVQTVPRGAVSAAALGLDADFVQNFQTGTLRYHELQMQEHRIGQQRPQLVVDAAMRTAADQLARGEEPEPVPTLEEATAKRESELAILGKAKGKVVLPLQAVLVRASEKLSGEFKRLADEHEADYVAKSWRPWNGTLHPNSGIGANDSGDLVPPLARALRQTAEHLGHIREAIQRATQSAWPSWESPESYLKRLVMLSPAELETMVAEPTEEAPRPTVLERIAAMF